MHDALTIPATTAAAARRQWAFYGALALLALVSLWLRQAIPLNVLGYNGVDDLLFASQARTLAQGWWLGSYDNMTHAKGMAYPAFIAASFHLGLPLKLSEHLLYLGAIALLAGVVARLAGRRAALAGFALMAFQPALWTPDLARVMREGFYMALTVLLFAVAVRLYLLPESPEERRRLGWPVLFGVLGAAYWLTREEGVWILPSLALPLLYWIAGRWRDGRALLWRVGVPLAVALVLVGGVSTINWALYGVFRTADFRSDDFLGAYGALARVRTGEDNPRFLFTAPVRAQVFAASPAARELQPLFDGAFGRQAQAMVCASAQADEPRRCDELVSGWLPWILRDAVRRLGYYRSAAEADAYYRRLAAEVDAACDAGVLSCLAPRRTLAPPFSAAYAWKTAARLGEAADLLTRFGGAAWQPVPPATGTPASLRLFQDVANMPLPEVTPRGAGLFLGGWAATAGGRPEILLRHRDGGSGSAERTLVEVVPEPGSRPTLRFHLTSGCAPADCVLVVRRGGGGEPLTFPLEPLPAAGILLDTDAATVVLEAAGPAEAGLGLALQQRMRGFREAAMRWLTLGYAWAMPPLAGLAVLLFLATLAAELRRRTVSAASVLGLALLGALAVRMLLLTYLETTSFVALTVYYMAPAYPLLCLFVVLALARWAFRRGWARGDGPSLGNGCAPHVLNQVADLADRGGGPGQAELQGQFAGRQLG